MRPNCAAALQSSESQPYLADELLQEHDRIITGGLQAQKRKQRRRAPNQALLDDPTGIMIPNQVQLNWFKDVSAQTQYTCMPAFDDDLTGSLTD